MESKTGIYIDLLNDFPEEHSLLDAKYSYRNIQLEGKIFQLRVTPEYRKMVITEDYISDEGVTYIRDKTIRVLDGLEEWNIYHISPSEIPELPVGAKFIEDDGRINTVIWSFGSCAVTERESSPLKLIIQPAYWLNKSELPYWFDHKPDSVVMIGEFNGMRPDAKYIDFPITATSWFSRGGQLWYT